MLSVPRRVQATNFTRRCRPVLPDLRRHAPLFVGSARKTANRGHQDGRAPALGLRQAARSSSAPRSCACTSGASTCPAPVRASATGVAPSSQWWRTAPLNRWWRLTWILSTCLATPRVVLHPRNLPHTLPGWTEWQHQAESVTSPQWFYFRYQPGGGGGGGGAAEQGDVLGTIQSALVQGQARDTRI